MPRSVSRRRNSARTIPHPDPLPQAGEGDEKRAALLSLRTDAAELSCDSDPGAVDLVAPVEADENGGERLDRGGVGERPGVEPTQPERLDEADDDVARLAVVAADEDV